MTAHTVTTRPTRDQTVAGVSIGVWLVADLAHAVWHHFYADGTSGDLISDVILTTVLGALLTIPLWAPRRRTLGATVLFVAGVYSIARGITGTFFSGEAAWIHVVLGLSGIMAFLAGAVRLRHEGVR